VSIPNIRILLRVLLWLIALHSFIAGVLLIVLSPAQLAYFGFEIQEKFFSTQGGVFHIVMCVAYVMGAEKPETSGQVIKFAISAKFIATVFLLSYYFFGNPIWMVLVSGVGDFFMGLVLLVVFLKFQKFLHAQT
jgi:hypothetical protein